MRFPKEVISLPYNTKFMTAEGAQYFRVIHNRQVKLCAVCMKPGHLKRECPELVCRECCEQGHYARDCTAVRCPDCRRAFMSCECDTAEAENTSEMSRRNNPS